VVVKQFFVDTHIRTISDDPPVVDCSGFRGSQFALGDPASAGGPRRVTCKVCRFPLEMLETISLAIPPDGADAVELLDEAASRARLYLGHLHSV
jgi:hypothetical protein